MKKEVKGENNSKTKNFPLKGWFNFSKKCIQKYHLALALKLNTLLALFLLLLSSFAFADGWDPTKASHGTLYVDTITSKTDGSSVNIADAQGLFVTENIITLGKVGIGTTDPGAKLSVGDGTTAGDQAIRIDVPVASVARFEIYKDGDPKWDIYTPASSNDLRFGYALGGTDRVIFQTVAAGGGRIGIGDTSPAGSLDVYGSDGTSRIALFTDDGAGSNPQIQAASGGGTVPGYTFFQDTNTGMLNSDTDELAFATAGATRVMIDPSGNVGVGTTGPGYKLDVAGQIRSSSGGFVFPDNTVQTTAAVGGGGGVGGSGTANYIPKWTDGTTLGNSVIYESAGNVGIGTTGPETPLHLVTTGLDGFRVTGSVSPRIDLYSTNTNGFARNWMLRTDTTVWGDFSIRQSNAHLGDPLLAGTTRFYIRNDGNVGIGTTDTGNILTVLQGSATDPIADAWTTYSSRRWKTNITKLENAMEKVLKLDGVSFNWKADGRHDIGLIAEDAGKIVPEAAAYEDNKVDAKSLDYNKFVPLLIESVKDLNAKTERLEEKNGKLESENIELKARLTNLEYKNSKV